MQLSSQTVRQPVKAIKSATSLSKLVQQCRDELASLNIELGVTLIWVSGHSGIVGNERADELTRQGSALQSSLEEMVNIPLGAMKGTIFSIHQPESNEGRAINPTRKIWPTYSKTRTNDLLCRPRQDIARIVAVCTGHWSIGVHAEKLGISYNTFCRSCCDQRESETIIHFHCKCPALANTRIKYFGKAFFHELDELSDIFPFLSQVKRVFGIKTAAHYSDNWISG